ncbi:hypothetical protein ACF3DV_32960 (plasmid) [Chlorogloeopsis fritschii PCC 9212]|nr:hypothetical protein [Chlorogloeopsis fritschii]
MTLIAEIAAKRLHHLWAVPQGRQYLIIALADDTASTNIEQQAND